MAHGLTTPVTTTESGTIETALVKNADGTAISNPTYVDCTANGTAANGQKKWVCANDAPGGTYPAGAQKFRVKGSNPEQFALSVTAGVVVAGSGTGLAAPTNLRQTNATASSATLAWEAAMGDYTLQRAPVTNGVAGPYTTVYTDVVKSAIDRGLAGSTTYSYRVAVTSGGVTSAYSTPVQLTTLAPSSLVINDDDPRITYTSAFTTFDAPPNTSNGGRYTQTIGEGYSLVVPAGFKSAYFRGFVNHDGGRSAVYKNNIKVGYLNQYSAVDSNNTQFAITDLVAGDVLKVVLLSGTLFSDEILFDNNDVNLPYVALTFTAGAEDMTTRHMIAGHSNISYTVEPAFAYVPPAGTNMTDVSAWYNSNGRLLAAHSGYQGYAINQFASDSLVVFGKSATAPPTLFDGNPMAVVHQIDMRKAGRMPAQFTPLVPLTDQYPPIFSSPEFVRLDNDRAGLFFMFQPRGLYDTSHIMYIESTDSTLTEWGNVTLIEGGNVWGYGVSHPGATPRTDYKSYIDPFHLFYQGKDMLVLRAFREGNSTGAGLGHIIVSSSTGILGPYDTLEAELLITDAQGNPTKMKNAYEGAHLSFLPGGGLRFFLDDPIDLGQLYMDSPTGGLQLDDFGDFQLVEHPGAFQIRHYTEAMR